MTESPFFRKPDFRGVPNTTTGGSRLHHAAFDLVKHRGKPRSEEMEITTNAGLQMLASDAAVDPRDATPLLKRTVGAKVMPFVLAGFVALGTVGGAQMAEPATAAAASNGSYVKNCLVKSPVSGRCDIWGAPYGISGNKLPNGQSNRWMNACGREAVFDAVIGMVAGPGGMITAIFLGCAKGLAQAAMFE